MKFKFPLILIICSIVVSSAFAQTPASNYSVKGLVVDTASNIKLINTTISILNSKDSTLVKFSRAITDGSFSITGLNKGKFILLLTRTGYADYMEQFELDSVKRAHDFGRLTMTTKARLLQEVIISGRAAVTIKGDTTEFSADKFKIEANSKVEDLLKQLPGMSIDKDGKITAQGQTVNKVLVDGEEFFGDDPTLVTKNIRGDMVDKVQLYDKKSDQATFTGIDDGQTTKTVNIVLKADKKNGYFGKADVGGATRSLYQGQALFNAFKTKQKASVYGTVGNTGKTGLSQADNSRLGASSTGVPVIDGGVFLISGGGGDVLESYNGRYDGRGIPLARTGGAHFDTKWNGDKETLNTNYKVGSLSVEGSSNSLSQTPLPTSVLNTNSTENKKNYVFRQKLDAAYTMQFNPATSLKITIDGTLINNETQSNFSTVRTGGDENVINNNARFINNKGEQKTANASLLWNKRFKKAGRTMSLGLSESYNKNDVTGYLNTATDFYNTSGILDSTGHVDQYKTNAGKSSVLNTNMTYTEPLTKTFTLTLNYGVAIRNESSDKKAFNKSGGGQYDVFDAVYSNNFDLDQTTTQAGAVFNYNKDKTLVNFGTRVSGVKFNQTDLYTSTQYKRNYINWTPTARYNYRFSQQKSLGFNYNGYTTQPRIDQIQPIRVNDDPLNIILGNADLKPSYRNSIGVNFNSYKVLTNQNFYLSGSYSITSNPIAQNRVTDQAGKSTAQSVNITDKKPVSYSLYSYITKKLKKTELNIGLDLSGSGGTSYNFINNAINTNQYYNYGAQLSLSKSVLNKYNFYFYGGPSFTVNKSSLQPQYDNNRMSIQTTFSFLINLPGKVEISSDMNYRYTEKAETLTKTANPNPLILNSTISKKFFKTQNLKLSFTGSDLMKQNVGFSAGPTSQSSYTTIQRYYMCSLIWDFNKMGGTTKPQN